MELLALDEASPEATAVRGAANDLVRAKTGNAAVLLGQIGVDVYPCEADCQFCSFGKSHTCFTEHVTMPIDEVVKRAKEFTKGGDLYALYLMTMHSFDKQYFLDCVRAVRAAIPASTRLVSNIGDTDREYFEQLKAAGLNVPPPKARHVFSDASLSLDAALAGQGVLLAYPVLASWALKEGRLVAPLPIRVETGMGYYFVTAPGQPEPRKVSVFKRWLRAAIAEDIDGFTGTVIPARSAASPSSP